MSCPTCQKLGASVEMSSFCSQECFKGYWAHHKPIHKMLKMQLQANVDQAAAMANFQFSGPLRPAKVSAKRHVPDHILRPDYADTGIAVSEEQASKQTPIYTREEIKGIREACKAGREVLDIAGRAIQVGMTTDEIDVIVHEACLERNCYPSPLNYYNFPKSVCTSINEVICHGIPDARPIENGDILNLDITVYKNGYHGDLNETFLVGDACDDESKLLVQTAFECLQVAIEMVKPGAMYRDLGKKISSLAQSKGFSVVKSYCGHGIGSLFHTAPTIPHYARNKAVGIMKPGHVFTIEPMINVGHWKDITWPDNWSAVTADGSRSAQFEHTILVTETGYEILTARDNEPQMCWDIGKVQRPLLSLDS